MSNYEDLINEFGEEKIDTMLSNSAGEIANSISSNTLILAYEQIKDESDADLDELDVMENDEEFFELLDATKRDIAFKVAFGDYNPHDQYVTLDGYENIKSISENEYDELLGEYSSEIIKIYFDKVSKNEVDFIEDIYEPAREILKEYN